MTDSASYFIPGGRAYRHFKRYQKILATLAKYGFGDLVQQLHLHRYVDFGRNVLCLEKSPELDLSRLPRPVLFRKALEELGPTFIKFGQLISAHTDIVGAAYREELEKLQDDVPPFAFAKAREILETAIGQPLETVFSEFPETPIASASIAQVYRARLQTGELVAVKVKRPDIDLMMQTDIEIMGHLAELLHRHVPAFSDVNLSRIISSFQNAVRKELDFDNERSNLLRFARQFAGNGAVRVPGVYEKISSRNVLVMEFIDGIKISNIAALRSQGLDTTEIANKVADLIFEQIFNHGFFHGDPHPGNLQVTVDGRICFMDYGFMGILPPVYRDLLGTLLIGFAARDSKKMARALIQMTEDSRRINRELLQFAIAEIAEEYRGYELHEIRTEHVFAQLLELLREFRLELRFQFYILLKTLVTFEGIFLELAPEMSYEKRLEPYIRQIIRNRLSLRSFKQEAFYAVDEFAGFLKELPGDFHDFMNQLMSGTAKLEFEHQGLEPMLQTYEWITKKVVFALILAALIIGSSLILHAGIPPLWHDVSILGLGGYLFSGIFAAWLLFSLSRHRF